VYQGFAVRVQRLLPPQEQIVLRYWLASLICLIETATPWGSSYHVTVGATPASEVVVGQIQIGLIGGNVHRALQLAFRFRLSAIPTTSSTIAS